MPDRIQKIQILLWKVPFKQAQHLLLPLLLLQALTVLGEVHRMGLHPFRMLFRCMGTTQVRLPLKLFLSKMGKRQRGGFLSYPEKLIKQPSLRLSILPHHQ